MRVPNRVMLIAVMVLALSVGGGAVGAHDGDHSGPGSTGPDLHSQNMKLLANVPRSAPATQSDLAFAGRYAYAGNYLGFRVIDISEPEHPHVVTDFR